MTIKSTLCGALLAAAISLPAFAQQPNVNPANGQPIPAVNPANGQPLTPPPAAGKKHRDCAKAKNPEKCEAAQQARAACKAKEGDERRECYKALKKHKHHGPRDCTKAKDPQKCEARQQARAACKGKHGDERRQCLKEQREKK